MSRPVRDANQSVLALRQLLEEVRRRPVHELDEKAVRKRADYMDRDFVDKVWREVGAIRGAELADAKRLREAVGAADVRHQVLHGLAIEELLEFPAGVVVFTGGDR